MPNPVPDPFLARESLPEIWSRLAWFIDNEPLPPGRRRSEIEHLRDCLRGVLAVDSAERDVFPPAIMQRLDVVVPKMIDAVNAWAEGLPHAAPAMAFAALELGAISEAFASVANDGTHGVLVARLAANRAAQSRGGKNSVTTRRSRQHGAKEEWQRFYDEHQKVTRADEQLAESRQISPRTAERWREAWSSDMK
ncbi:MAG TPA: hypothetical protein VF595_00470 [Tepidisphaeraceae bacterium]|jgi:hypothetical protein